MKGFAYIARLIVGLLFMFSGFVKMVDPVGFSYKLEEYFGPGVLNVEFLIPFALAIAVVLVIFEFIVGVMLLLGYAKNFTRWTLLLLIVFFTFLTFYSAYFNKVTDCGCFGDAIPLDPWQSFYKDLILLVLVIFLFIKHEYIESIFTEKINKLAIFIISILCLGLTYQVIMHLPIIDFRPYKIGANIPEQMQAHGNKDPKIHDFFIIYEGEEITDEVLEKDKVLLVSSTDMKVDNEKGWKRVKELTDEALEKDYFVIGLTSSLDEDIEKTIKKYHLNFNFADLDATTVKTIVRSNPGVLTVEKGTITQKVHWNDIDKLNLD